MNIFLNEDETKALIQALRQNGQAALVQKLEDKMTTVPENEAAFRNRAFERHHRDGELEIDDDDAIVSAGADGQGAYVQAWVWVSNEEIE